mmetsp:Transcript_12275/g.14671  ORF Transcript_12275/g.14671 Transcript_12275/m.14671 type:complete len:259 (-) Transcript_12275:257-1033(-)|eukprot:CAMPEP_0197844044 /NCGR_PEP_ID=MMETSP1438-20131217/1011_1 /TAXON_ID=1461541 /ORGANISM="Pterosperma sp., Strain CCMP1384" /LENGTH=258 /DNA_ID=CAMNT_0043454589 /DNA_START=124 /DNA_END=900 /DNA_ORIENTATION=-
MDYSLVPSTRNHSYSLFEGPPKEARQPVPARKRARSDGDILQNQAFDPAQLEIETGGIFTNLFSEMQQDEDLMGSDAWDGVIPENEAVPMDALDQMGIPGDDPLMLPPPVPTGRGNNRHYTQEELNAAQAKAEAEGDHEFRNVQDPVLRRRLQNRAASARFRARGRQRTREVEILRKQVAELSAHNKALETELATVKSEREEDQIKTQETTLNWVLAKFRLRRRISWQTISTAVTKLNGLYHLSNARDSASTTNSYAG